MDPTNGTAVINLSSIFYPLCIGGQVRQPTAIRRGRGKERVLLTHDVHSMCLKEKTTHSVML